MTNGSNAGPIDSNSIFKRALAVRVLALDCSRLVRSRDSRLIRVKRQSKALNKCHRICRVGGLRPPQWRCTIPGVRLFQTVPSNCHVDNPIRKMTWIVQPAGDPFIRDKRSPNLSPIQTTRPMTLVKFSLLALLVLFTKRARGTLCRGLQSDGLIGYCIEYYDVSQYQACQNADKTVEGAIAGD